MTTKWPGGFITASPTAPSSSAASGVWTIEQAAYYPSQNAWPTTPGQQAYTSAGTFSWVAPAGVNLVCVVLVGPGGNNGGSGGALSYQNNIAVNPGASYAVRVASGGSGQTSYFEYQGSTTNLRAGNGSDRSGQGGGNGGTRNGDGGGGAGGYSGNGGNGGYPTSYGTPQSQDGSGGGGGGGSYNPSYNGGAGGGGVGILGQGSNGTRGNSGPGGGGSGGTNGSGVNFNCCIGTFGGNGGTYGGGAGATSYGNGVGGRGAVRIIWGAGRAFPSTNTGDL